MLTFERSPAIVAAPADPAETVAVSLPTGVRAEWNLDQAFRESTATREKICINGLWRWQPASPSSAQPPATNWGYFKVPGSWPGITDYMQKDDQTVHVHPHWSQQRLGSVHASWYDRTVTVPKNWVGRHVALSVEYLNSYAAVYVDGTRRGEIGFPGGELDLTPHLQAGATQRLSLLIVALPLKGVLLSYTDSNAAREVPGRVARRGLCGDVFLVSTPTGPRLGDVRVETSFRKATISFDAALTNLSATGRYSLTARVTSGGNDRHEFTSREFSASEATNGRYAFSAEWKPDACWDIHTPSNQFVCSLRLRQGEPGGNDFDVGLAVPFGFREFWIEGRDFYLNGSKIFLSAVPLDNAQVGTALASYTAARESLERLKSIGINFVYTHHYGCEPGAHLGFAEILRAADDVGMLVAFSQPHFSHYEWRTPDADRTNGYARHAEYYARTAQNHPGVVAYAMSHNATGYDEDMNPDLIAGREDPRNDTWSRRNAALALRAEAIVQGFDPSRIVYHHASGNLGSMHVDVTGRDARDPVAETLTQNILEYVRRWRPSASRSVVYAGEPAGQQHLESAGFAVRRYDGGDLAADQVLVAGPGAGGASTGHTAAIVRWLKQGGHMLGVGLDQSEIDKLLPVQVRSRRGEHLSTAFAPAGVASPLCGVGPADVHNRDPRELSLLTSKESRTAGFGWLWPASTPDVRSRPNNSNTLRPLHPEAD